jgi:hypothetical protein
MPSYAPTAPSCAPTATACSASTRPCGRVLLEHDTGSEDLPGWSRNSRALRAFTQTTGHAGRCLFTCTTRCAKNLLHRLLGPRHPTGGSPWPPPWEPTTPSRTSQRQLRTTPPRCLPAPGVPGRGPLVAPRPSRIPPALADLPSTPRRRGEPRQPDTSSTTSPRAPHPPHQRPDQGHDPAPPGTSADRPKPVAHPQTAPRDAPTSTHTTDTATRQITEHRPGPPPHRPRHRNRDPGLAARHHHDRGTNEPPRPPPPPPPGSHTCPPPPRPPDKTPGPDDRVADDPSRVAPRPPGPGAPRPRARGEDAV